MSDRRRYFKALLASVGVISSVVLLLWAFERSSVHLVVPETGTAAADPVAPLVPLEESAPSSAKQVSTAVASIPRISPLASHLAAELDALQLEADLIKRDGKLQKLAQSIVRADLPEALNILAAQKPSPLVRDLETALLRRWAGGDPQAAAEWAAGRPVGSEQRIAINTVAIAWAAQNLTNAIAWVRQLPPGGGREDGLLTLAYESARTDPVVALNLAMELPAGSSQADFITHAVRQWAGQSPEAAVAWAKQISDVSLHDAVVAAIATSWSDTNPSAAGALAVGSLSAGRLQDNAVVSIVQNWAQTEPEKAAAWVEQFRLYSTNRG